MARSSIKTWLSLDRWAEIIGIFPLHFNGLSSNTIHPSNVCGEIFFQFAWQHSDRTGRDEIAMAIQASEQEIAAEVGYNLMPDWTIEERHTCQTPFAPGVYNLNGLNPRGMFNSVELNKGHVISGGVVSKVLISNAAAIVRTDPNGDGYSELCTVVVATTVTDEDEIRAYYPGHYGADEWEIRPISVSIAGGNATITFKSWQIPIESSFDTLDPDPLDADVVGSYITTVDVYRVYNNIATQVQFMWENNGIVDCCGSCVACQFSTQAGCFHLREQRLGIAVPAPASWDSRTEEYTEQEWSACRAPDQIRFWYYSGYQDKGLARPLVTMAPYWEYAVAYFAASKLDRPVCGCSNVNQFIEKWRMDLLVNKNDDVSFNATPEMLANRLGTTMGGIYAWKRIQQNGMRVNK